MFSVIPIICKKPVCKKPCKPPCPKICCQVCQQPACTSPCAPTCPQHCCQVCQQPVCIMNPCSPSCPEPACCKTIGKRSLEEEKEKQSCACEVECFKTCKDSCRCFPDRKHDVSNKKLLRSEHSNYLKKINTHFLKDKVPKTSHKTYRKIQDGRKHHHKHIKLRHSKRKDSTGSKKDELQWIKNEPDENSNVKTTTATDLFKPFSDENGISNNIESDASPEADFPHPTFLDHLKTLKHSIEGFNAENGPEQDYPRPILIDGRPKIDAQSLVKNILKSGNTRLSFLKNLNSLRNPDANGEPYVQNTDENAGEKNGENSEAEKSPSHLDGNKQEESKKDMNDQGTTQTRDDKTNYAFVHFNGDQTDQPDFKFEETPREKDDSKGQENVQGESSFGKTDGNSNGNEDGQGSGSPTPQEEASEKSHNRRTFRIIIPSQKSRKNQGLLEAIQNRLIQAYGRGRSKEVPVTDPNDNEYNKIMNASQILDDLLEANSKPLQTPYGSDTHVMVNNGNGSETNEIASSNTNTPDSNTTQTQIQDDMHEMPGNLSVLESLLKNSKPVAFDNNTKGNATVNSPSQPAQSVSTQESLPQAQPVLAQGDQSKSVNDKASKADDKKSTKDAKQTNRDKTENDKYDYLEKMIKSYGYYRTKQDQLSKLHKQHQEIKNQKTYLQNLLNTKNNDHKSKGKKSKGKNRAKDKAKQKAVQKIAKQLQKLKKQQQQIMNAQAQLQKQLQHESEYFGQMNHIAQKTGNSFVQDKPQTTHFINVLDAPHKVYKKKPKHEKNLKTKVKLQDMDDAQYLTPSEINAWSGNNFQETLKQEYDPFRSDFNGGQETTVFDTRPSYHGYQQNDEINSDLTSPYRPMGKNEVVNEYRGFNNLQDEEPKNMYGYFDKTEK